MNYLLFIGWIFLSIIGYFSVRYFWTKPSKGCLTGRMITLEWTLGLRTFALITSILPPCAIYYIVLGLVALCIKLLDKIPIDWDKKVKW